MRFIMVGAGGVGGYFGGRLAASGADVGFLARGDHLAALRRSGLVIESPLGDAHVQPVDASDDAGDLGPADVVFICVKLTDSDAAMAALKTLAGPATAVISLQNGVEAEDRLARALGPGRVAGGVAYIAASVAAPGTIRHIGANQRIELGRLADGPAADKLGDIVAALTAAGIDAEAVADITRAIWRKFVFLVALSASTTLTGRPIGDIRADRDGRGFLRDLMGEAAAVARARGIALGDDFIADRLAFTDTLPAAMTSSMAHDAAAGKPLELAWLSGAVVRLGDALGVPTPANRAAVAVLNLRNRRETASKAGN